MSQSAYSGAKGNYRNIFKIYIILYKMEVSFYKIPVNKYFYTIKARYGMNNKYELYCRTQIIYGRFIDQDTFEYNVVHNNKIQEDGLNKYCRKIDLFKHDNDYIYMFNDYEEAKKTNNIIKEDLLKVPMKYNDYESIKKMLKILGKE